MAKKKAKTNAIRIVEQKKISYIEHEYPWQEDDLSGKSVAEHLNADPSRIFKTLVAVGNKTGPIVAVIPSNQELDLKKIAKASGNKKVEMLHVKELEELTGYIRGGCSPIGMKKLLPTYFDASALQYETITVSAGRRGIQMELAPKELAQLVSGEFVAIV
ncbi:MAG TPA: Cys-tRNA(Pro) deacylase [Candidatus Jeotgalibaca pullicola]|nr:Cys-tRNA(Pro) deacylase [Candidatus Jeotgalibaca pullicola]